MDGPATVGDNGLSFRRASIMNSHCEHFYKRSLTLFLRFITLSHDAVSAFDPTEANNQFSLVVTLRMHSVQCNAFPSALSQSSEM
jgi:hypothetical protein